MINIRLATMDDAGLLLMWRNEEHSRRASRNQNEIELGAHLAWLQRALSSDSFRVAIAEHAGTPIGSVRAEKRDGCWEMSWVLAPEARGKGLAKPMVLAFRESLDGDVCAWIKDGNVASVNIAKSLGLSLRNSKDGFGFYS